MATPMVFASRAGATTFSSWRFYYNFTPSLTIDKLTSAIRYEIPADNPFRDRDFLPEVYASGFRNPWRFSVDPQTHEIWVGDVGGRHVEEVNLIKPGQHYGWPEFEGALCIRDTCKGGNTEPLTSHPTSSFAAVLGGFYYRGKIGLLRNKYVYASLRGHLWAFDKTTGEDIRLSYSLPGHNWFSLTMDQEGELLFLAFDPPLLGAKDDAQRTKIFRIVDVVSSPPEKLEDANSLVALGCSGNRLKRAHRPYEISLPKWEGSLSARRYAPKDFAKNFFGLQPRPFHPQEMYIRELYFEDQPIETQMIAYHQGVWQTIAFAWDEPGKDATQVVQPKVRELPNGETWLHRSPAECQLCHNTRQGWILGYKFSQLDRPVKYHGQWVNQLDNWVKQRFMKEIPPERRTHPMPDPTKESADIAERARAYLEVNCAYCHRQGALAQHVGIDLHRHASLESMGWCHSRRDHFIIDPRTPSESLILQRMRDTEFPMPPDRRQVDKEGFSLVENWIKTLPQCLTEKSVKEDL